jgi:hypothetical protein
MAATIAIRAAASQQSPAPDARSVSPSGCPKPRYWPAENSAADRSSAPASADTSKQHDGERNTGVQHSGEKPGTRVRRSKAPSSGLDAPRRRLRDALATAGLSLKEASRAIGRNDAYLQQFLYRELPRRLPEEARHRLATILDIDQQQLADRHLSAAMSDRPPAQISVPFFDVRAAAGGGAMPPDLSSSANSDSQDNAGNPEVLSPIGLGFPSSLLRRITSAPAASLQLISVSGDSMDPTLADGDLVMIDTARKQPSPPGIFILDDGVGLVAKRVDAVPNTTPPMLRLSSDNPAHSNYQRHLDEVHIIGQVIWFGRSLQ